MATDQNIFNLFVGSSDLYVDDVWVGWTRGGVRLRVNKSLWGRPSFSGLGVDEIVKQSEDFYISTLLVETSLTNLRQAWGINEAAVGFRVDFGGSTTIPVHTLRFVAKDGFFESYFYKVVAVDFGEVTFSRTQDAAIPVTFRAILDTNKSVGAQIGYIIRRLLNQSNLDMRVNVPKIQTKALFVRTLVFKRSSSNVVSRLTVSYSQGSKSLVDRVTVLDEDFKNLVSRLAVVFAADTKNLQSTVTVVYAESYKDLVSTIEVLIANVENLISRVGVVYAEDSKDLQSTVTVVYAEGSLDLVGQLEVLKDTYDYVRCRLSVVYTAGSSDLVAQVAIIGVDSTYMGGIVEVLKKTDRNLICLVTVAAA